MTTTVQQLLDFLATLPGEDQINILVRERGEREKAATIHLEAEATALDDDGERILQRLIVEVPRY